MNVTLEVKPLADALAVLKSVLGNHPGTVLITDTGDGEATFAVSHLIAARVAVYTAQAKLTGDGDSIAVPLAPLQAQVDHASLSTDVVTLRSTDRDSLQLKAKRVLANIKGYSGKSLSGLPWMLPDPEVELEASGWKHLLSSTKRSMDDVTGSPDAGVNLSVTDVYVRATSNDSAHMTLAEVPIPQQERPVFAVALPKPLVEHTLKLIGKLNSEAPVSLGVNGNLLYFWSGGQILSCPMLDKKKFRDISVFLDFDIAAGVEVKVGDLQSIVTASIPFAILTGSDVPRIEISHANGQLKIRASNQSVGDFEAELPVERRQAAADFSFALNGYFLDDFLAATKAISERILIVPPDPPPAGMGKQCVRFRPAEMGGNRLIGWCSLMGR